MKALLVLEDGFYLFGHSLTGPGEVFGEVVFCTGMGGYQEMITDPSYCEQIITFTYPLIGNYGINPRYNESFYPRTPAVLMKECCRTAFHRESKESLLSFLDYHGIMGIEGIDTRSLTLHLRREGTMKGAISTYTLDPGELKLKLGCYPEIAGANLAQKVTTSQAYSWDPAEAPGGNRQENAPHVVVIDLGVKHSILKALSSRGCRVTVVPAGTSAEEIKAREPQGILLSNGPGDPAPLDHIIPTLKKLTGWRPLMGICLGHQLLGRLQGIETFKLNFGHRGINHPVKSIKEDRVYITTQNHGFCLSMNKKLPQGTEITYVSLFDGTLEGLENTDEGLFSVQFHPEASPGPHDTSYLFDKFCDRL